LINQEPGAERVAEALAAGGVMSAVNLAEVISRLAEAGMPEDLIHQTIDPLGIDVADFEVDLAYQTGLLRPPTRPAGLSLGDRACLALARRLDLPALTADRRWAELQLDVNMEQVR
jgi:PIN domain nuclease of toxin-antitoxin system